MTTRRVRSLALAGALLVASGALVTASVASAPTASAAPIQACPPDGGMPGIGEVLTYEDSSPAVWVGGDYLATGGAAESEGLLVVVGDATVAKGEGRLNVGTVGVGSGITPPEGSPMLRVGGDVLVVAPSILDVGAGAAGGGDVLAGGVASGTIETNGGDVTMSLGAAAALGEHAAFGDEMASESAALASAEPNGTVAIAGLRATFTGGTGDGLQRFEVDAAALAAVSELAFVGLPAGSPIVITVTGGPVETAFTYVEVDGERVDDFASPDFGNTASRILWNLPDAMAATIGGTSQFMGSILAPNADVDVTASTNGRLFVGGDLTTAGDGNEHHSYPWIGGIGACIDPLPPEGTFTAAKVLTGDGVALVPDDAVFTLAWSAVDPGGAPSSGTLALPASGEAVPGPSLPEGTVVTFAEATPPPVEGVRWGEPAVSPASVTIAADAVATVTVTNVASRAAVDPPTDPPTEPPVDPPTEPPVVDPPTDPPTSPPVVDPPDAGGGDGELPRTGAQPLLPALAVALAALAVGAGLVRRRVG